MNGNEPDELPPDEGVIERIDVGRDERTAPVDVKAHWLKIRLCQRRKVFEPVVAVGEFQDLEKGWPHYFDENLNRWKII